MTKTAIFSYPPEVKLFVQDIRRRFDKWKKQHEYDEGMRGGYGNPILGVDLMTRIENLIEKGEFDADWREIH